MSVYVLPPLYTVTYVWCSRLWPLVAGAAAVEAIPLHWGRGSDVCAVVVRSVTDMYVHGSVCVCARVWWVFCVCVVVAIAVAVVGGGSVALGFASLSSAEQFIVCVCVSQIACRRGHLRMHRNIFISVLCALPNVESQHIV